MRVHVTGIGDAVNAERLSRDQFQARLAALDDAAVRKVLWTLYWRGGAAVRQRIEADRRRRHRPTVGTCRTGTGGRP